MPREERDGAVHKGHTGTLRWMAPEVLGKMSRYTEKVRRRSNIRPTLARGGLFADVPVFTLMVK